MHWDAGVHGAATPMSFGFRNPFKKLSKQMTRHLAAASPSRAVHGLPIAVDFGVGSLKVLQVTSEATLPLVAAACLETPADLWTNHTKRLEFQLEALPKLIRHGGFKGKRAVCAIPSWSVVCKHLQFPKHDGVEVEDLVAAAVPVQLQCDPSAVVYRYFEVEGAKTGGKTEVAVIATPREVVDRLMRGLMQAKLEPVGMHTEFSALLRAFDAVRRREGDQLVATLYLDIGASSTSVLIAHGPAMAFARVIGVGGVHFDAAVMKQLKCGEEEARQARMTAGRAVSVAMREASPVAAGAPLGGHIGEERRGEERTMPGFSAEFMSQPLAGFNPEGVDLSEPLEMLTDEVSMCLRYHAAQFPEMKVERAVFVGGEARSLGLCQRVAQALKVSAQMADPLARVGRTGGEPALGIDMKQAQPGWCVPLGLCLSPTDL
ncbi:MAG: hypothetical protein HBSAPP03_07300 [Phycisphaerae bacterium]|nr:MAG: hypothetical protein HBSAPP03_07300 [Phycisphaerae bacterium]